MDQVLDLPISEVFCDDEFNSRGYIIASDVIDLAKDISEQGLLQPIVVQPWSSSIDPSKKYRIICGHRRFMAHRVNKWVTIKSLLKVGLTETQALVMNMSENLKRKDLTIMQEARVCERFKKLGWDIARIAKTIGCARRWVEVRIALLALPEEIQKRAEAGLLTQHQIDEIAKKATVEEQYALTRKCVDHKLRGEKGSFAEAADVKVADPRKRLARTGEPRNKTEILEMQSHIQDTFKQNSHFGARVLAWAMGIISSEDLYSDLEKIVGSEYKRPVIQRSAVA